MNRFNYIVIFSKIQTRVIKKTWTEKRRLLGTMALALLVSVLYIILPTRLVAYFLQYSFTSAVAIVAYIIVFAIWVLLSMQEYFSELLTKAKETQTAIDEMAEAAKRQKKDQGVAG